MGVNHSPRSIPGNDQLNTKRDASPASLSVAITKVTPTCRKNNPRPASQIQSPQREFSGTTHGRQHTGAQKSDPVTGAASREELPVGERLIYMILTPPGQTTTALCTLIRRPASHAHHDCRPRQSQHPIGSPTQSNSPITDMACQSAI